MKRFIPLLTLVILFSACTTNTEQNNTEPMEETQQENQTETSEVMEETQPAPSTIEMGYNNESPEWETIKSKIESQTEETLQSFYVPSSPKTEDLVFVSTSSNIPLQWSEDITSTNKIYSLDMPTGELTKLYEEEENRLLRTMGIDGDKLIVMYDGLDNSPGPCFSVWADWENFGALDVSKPSDLMAYTVPEDQVEKAKQEQAECMEEMGL